ncbi:hypothetical protein VZT92_014971 [Zoarces viviparus]|uniref:Uncharacterized protein n=1 Tax=Zoarces viviparus TaxID=48416 RepID=A0AAW1EVJ4_ZOAVI
MNASKSGKLVPTTVYVSYRTDKEDHIKYYGVSMSARGSDPKEIMIAASCFSSWDSSVADAVMTYYPDNIKKADFDGTIELPQDVTCEAFNLLNEEPKDPCRHVRTCLV